MTRPRDARGRFVARRTPSTGWTRDDVARACAAAVDADRAARRQLRSTLLHTVALVVAPALALAWMVL